MARDYELGIIINPDVGDEQARAIVDRVTQTVAGSDGQVVRVNAWGRRRLAYPIEHHRDGLYFYFDLILEPETTAELERTLRVNEDIMRHLLKSRDARVVTQQRQREAEADAQAAADAAAAEAAAAAAAEAAQAAPAAEAAAETAEPAEPAAEAPEAPEEAAPAEADTPAAETAETAEAGEQAQATTEETTEEETPATAEAEANA